MKKKKFAILIFSSFLLFLNGEDFIDASKELNGFSTQYGFGEPVKQITEIKIDKGLEKNESTDDINISKAFMEQKTVETQEQKFKKELNIKCGGKCGINFKRVPKK